MSRLWTWCVRIKERALRIGLWLKPSSDLQVVRPELLRLGPPLLRRQRKPFEPFRLGEQSLGFLVECVGHQSPRNCLHAACPEGDGGDRDDSLSCTQAASASLKGGSTGRR